MNTNTVSIADIQAELPGMYLDGCLFETPLMLWGPPGIGKSMAVKGAIADVAHKLDDPELTMWDIRLAYYAPEDLRGLPYRDGDNYRLAHSRSLPQLGERGILFLDEFTLAPPTIGNLATNLFLDRRIDEYRLPDGVAIVVAGNRLTDRAGAFRMSTAVADRLMHWEVSTNADDVVAYLLRCQDVDPTIPAFLRFRPDLLSTFDPTNADIRFCTPRTWEKAGRIVKNSTGHTRDLRLAGILGDGPLSEFLAFLRVADHTESSTTILAQPDTANVPDRIDVLWATIGALIAAVSDSTASAFMTYVRRLPAEFAYKAVLDLKSKDPALLDTTEAIAWMRNNAHRL